VHSVEAKVCIMGSEKSQHWESVYSGRDHKLFSWHQAVPELSIQLIQRSTTDPNAPIIDVGGGASRLVDELHDLGFNDLTVTDLSSQALTIAQDRLGDRSDTVTWIHSDVTEQRFERIYQVWHDRAVFHFLTEPERVARYLDRMTQAVEVGGYVIIATFALDGPDSCSGLPVQRYSPGTLQQTLGSAFKATRFEHESHLTPRGVIQEFTYGLFQRQSGA
jgi:2-polyprenyl-3-methyl-5-hydroxy-6-metoxy-1,4-benzoquinol methylase